jgi:hypothetical protein
VDVAGDQIARADVPACVQAVAGIEGMLDKAVWRAWPHVI